MNKEIDYKKLALLIVKNKKRFAINLAICFVLSSAIALCIPRYYKCSVQMAPESSKSSLGSLSSLAASVGIGGMSKMMESEDAIFPDIYPDVLGSRQFIMELFDKQVSTKDGELKCDYYTYMLKHQSNPFWTVAMAWIKRQFASKPKPTVAGDDVKKSNILILSKEEDTIIEAVKANINCAVDKKTGVISLTVQAQDPLVATQMCEYVCTNLQEFIANYRTTKARNDFEYFSKMAEEAYEKYDEARRTYSQYCEANIELSLASYRTKQEDLENDMQLKYSMYSMICNQRQAAEARVQESTPAFTMLDRPAVPIKHAGPKRMIGVAFMLFLTFVGTLGWLYFKTATRKE